MSSPKFCYLSCLSSFVFHCKNFVFVFFLLFLQCLCHKSVSHSIHTMAKSLVRQSNEKTERNFFMKTKFCNRCDTECITDTCIDFFYFSDRFFFDAHFSICLFLGDMLYQKKVSTSLRIYAQFKWNGENVLFVQRLKMSICHEN